MTVLDCVYLKQINSDHNIDYQIHAVKEAYPELQEHRLLVDVCGVCMRDEWLLNDSYLRKGDTLTVWDLGTLGTDYHDGKNTYETLIRRGVIIKVLPNSFEFKSEDNILKMSLRDCMAYQLIANYHATPIALHLTPNT